MSNASFYSHESDLAPSDNILDLRISACNFDHQCIVSLLGGQDL